MKVLKLSISNIAWENSINELVYTNLKELGYQSIEIAPTKLFPKYPYNKLGEAKEYSYKLTEEYGLGISSIQSIWYGRNEKIFENRDSRESLIEYTKKAVLFSVAIGAKNLVFGSPKNRVISNEKDYEIAYEFFNMIGQFAAEHGTVIALEANPPIYNTNFINTTKEAFDFVKAVNCDGLKVNLDIGTMIHNSEEPKIIEENLKYINHVHISEPGLKKIEIRPFHNEIAEILWKGNYSNSISIEMGLQSDINEIIDVAKYVKNIVELEMKNELFEKKIL